MNTEYIDQIRLRMHSMLKDPDAEKRYAAIVALRIMYCNVKSWTLLPSVMSDLRNTLRCACEAYVSEGVHVSESEVLYAAQPLAIRSEPYTAREVRRLVALHTGVSWSELVRIREWEGIDSLDAEPEPDASGDLMNMADLTIQYTIRAKDISPMYSVRCIADYHIPFSRPGAYMMYGNNRPLLAGMSKNDIHGRIASHLRPSDNKWEETKRKSYTHYAYIYSEPHMAPAIEDMLIKRYRPPYNLV